MNGQFAIDIASDEDAASHSMPARDSIVSHLGTLANPGIRNSHWVIFEHSNIGAREAFIAFARVNDVRLVEDTYAVGNQQRRRLTIHFPNGSLAEVLP